MSMGNAERRNDIFTDDLMIDRSQSPQTCCMTKFQIVGARCNFGFVMCHSIEKRPGCVQQKSLMLAMRSLQLFSQSNIGHRKLHDATLGKILGMSNVEKLLSHPATSLRWARQ